MNHKINVKCTTIKLQRKYGGLGLGKELVAMTQKHDPKRGKIDELDLIEMKNFCSANNPN